MSRLLATDLYNIDFTPPDLGSYDVVFGAPSVQSSLGPFTDGLLFHAVHTYDQIRLPVTMLSPRYEIQFDVFSHNLLNTLYGFTVSLDTPYAETITLHGPLNEIDAAEFGRLMDLSDDKVYHFDIKLNFEASQWSIAIDNTFNASALLYGSQLNSVRFTMSPVFLTNTDAPGTYAALDNVVVTATPEPSAALLVLAGTMIGVGLRRLNAPAAGCAQAGMVPE